MTTEEMDRLTAGVVTKADKMRILERHAVPRADIARFLGVRYQQVRNTLEGDKRTGYNPALGVPHSPQSEDGDSDSEVYRLLTVASDGSLQLPPDLVEAIPNYSERAIYALVGRDGLLVTSFDGAMRRLSREL